jgi:tRNA nucleotidyltransferase (CCA-adding enzyme)
MDPLAPSTDAAGRPDLLDTVRAIASAVRKAGGRVLVVGGWVRDRLLGRESKDVDLEIYGLTAAAVRALLDGVGPVETVGESFTVYKIRDIDVALPRRESKVAPGHRGFEVRGDPFMSFDEAFRRRDFTVNAIGWDPLTGEHIDPVGGRADLERGVLRAVDQATFGDDSLRVLRAVQLAGRFGFHIDDATVALCRAVPLDDLPAERVWGEVEKLLLKAPRPSIGFQAGLTLDVIHRLFPEMAALVGCEQEPDWHPEGDVWVHTLMVIDECRRRIDDLPRSSQVALMLGAVCHDFGKPATTAFADGRIRSYNHEDAGVPPTLAFLNRLKVHAIDGVDVRHQVVGLVAHHLKPGMWHKAQSGVGDGAFRRLAQKVDLELLARLATADCIGRTGKFDCAAMEWFLARARSLGVEHRPPAPLLLGRHLLALGISPGPGMGEILREVYERQLDGEIASLEQALEAARRILKPSI